MLCNVLYSYSTHPVRNIFWKPWLVYGMVYGWPSVSGLAVNTDKKENQIFLINKEIQNGAAAKSYMRKGFLIYEEIWKYFFIYEFAKALFWISLSLVRMALLVPLCRMAKTFQCPCSTSSLTDPKIVSEDTNKMSKS